MANRGEMAAHYDPAAAAAAHAPAWERAGLDRGDPGRPGPPFSIVIPPPNVTGSLHMGHALNNTLQDVLARYKRMDGFNVVWIPGADHASIAVHWVVERQLRAEGTDRQTIGREAFLARAWAFKEATQKTIFGQQRQLGVSCDWSRLRFTLDEGLSDAVRETFVRLYEDGLIYRDERLVNWDPVSQTTLSDLEVVHEEGVRGELFSFAYPLADGDGELVVATTRPETIVGDTAVAVHPDDPRYRHLVGRMLRHPLVDRQVPVVADAILVDPAFGTGAVKVTPAHDFNDFEVGRRHSLPLINILHRDGTLNEAGGPYAGMTVLAARAAIKEKLDALGLGRGSTAHRLNIGRSERSGAVVEPLLSTQWYVRTRPLAAPALAAVENGFMAFWPDAWKNTYYAWLRNVRDWCISRQLWWGHRIPAWYCEPAGHVNVARAAPERCGTCGATALRQDDDILDTWFSSALWPFSTMGWPQKTADLQRWYPTSVLITSFDIIFFWVARMMMFGQYFMGEVPFRDVYIHALIRDAEGAKMSKTKGNVVDPQLMIDRYGCDAFRFTLVAFAGQGRDVRWDEARAAGYHKFVNKLWQALRFVRANLGEGYGEGAAAPAAEPSVYDRWILGRLGECVGRVRAALDGYRFNDAASAAYGFVWDELCDWYLEVAKPTLYEATPRPAAVAAVRQTLVQVFAAVCRLLHPFMPFLSEEMWQHLPGHDGSVTEAPYPRAADFPVDAAATAEAGFVAALVTGIRRIRAEYTVAPKAQLTAVVRGSAQQTRWLTAHADVIRGLARATAQPLDGPPPAQVATCVVDGAEVMVPLAGLIDVAAETARLHKEIERTEREAARLAAQLDNADFIGRAPEAVVQDKRAQLQAAGDRLGTLRAALARL